MNTYSQYNNPEDTNSLSTFDYTTFFFPPTFGTPPPPPGLKSSDYVTSIYLSSNEVAIRIDDDDYIIVQKDASVQLTWNFILSLFMLLISSYYIN